MATVRLSGKGNIDEVSALLKSGITASGLSCELVDSSIRSVGGEKAILLVFEKYYMRASNRASLSIMLTHDGDTVYVDAIGAGGGQGALLKFSWGAEESFVSIVPNILNRMGFR
jgi:hypothetical protein